MILGIDPGLHGSLAIYDEVNHRLVSVIDMPLLPAVSKKRPQIDTQKLSDWIGLYSTTLILSVVERVNAFPGQDIQSMFTFGYGAGMLHGILTSYSVPIKFVQPSVWKAVLNLSSDKEKSLLLVRKIFPNDAPLFARKKDDGRAEAVLLAYLGGIMLKSGTA